MMNKTYGFCLLTALLILLCRPAGAVTEVSALRPGGSAGQSLTARLLGGNWDDLTDALLEARQSGKTEVTLKLNGETFKDYRETGHVWYYAARAGLKSASCSYWDDGRIRLTEFEWWPWPMYLVHSQEDFLEALAERKNASGETFGLLPDEELFRSLMDDGRTMTRLEYRGGMTGYGNLYYNDNSCSVWFIEPTLEETVYLEASGPAACVEALLGAGRRIAARPVLAMDGAAYARLSADDDLRGSVLGMGGINSSYRTSDEAQTYLFPAAREAFYPGFVIAQAVRYGQEDTLSPVQKRALAKARDLTRDVRGTELEKASQIHDILCRHIVYTIDESTEDDDCCIGALLDGKANCDGYSDAFTLCALLNGLTVRYIEGDSLEKDQPGEEGGHMWNLILLDGSWRSLDVTWGDQEENGISYRFFNIGLERMEKSYRFSRELLPAPFAGATDLSARPVREWTAGSPEELRDAVAQALEAGQDSLVVHCSDALYSAYQKDSGVLFYAVSSAGAETERSFHADKEKDLTLEGLRKLDHWAFCRTREDVEAAVRRFAAQQASGCTLTLETVLFDAYLKDSGVVSYAVSSAGAETESTVYYTASRTVALEGLRKRDGWSFCRTREEVVSAAEKICAMNAQTYDLTLEKTLFSQLFSDPELTELYMLLAKGGIFSARLSWLNESCTVTVKEPEWRKGYYAEDILTAGDLTRAVREGVRQGFSDFYLCLSESLYGEMMADTNRLSRAVRDGGFKDSWSYYYWEGRHSVYIVSQ